MFFINCDQNDCQVIGSLLDLHNALLRWLRTVSNTFQDLNHSLSVDATTTRKVAQMQTGKKFCYSGKVFD